MSTRSIVQPKFKTRNLVSVNDIPVAAYETGKIDLENFISTLKEIDVPGLGKVMFFTNYINLVTGEVNDNVLESI